MTLTDADNLILARKGALHEKLTEFFKNLQGEMERGTLDVSKFVAFSPSFLAANLLTSITRSGDGRISDQTLSK